MEGNITETIEAKADTSIRTSQSEAASKRNQLKKTVLRLAAGTAAVASAIGIGFFPRPKVRLCAHVVIGIKAHQRPHGRSSKSDI